MSTKNMINFILHLYAKVPGTSPDVFHTFKNKTCAATLIKMAYIGGALRAAKPLDE